MSELGKKFRDVVTGFEGTCIGRVEYLTGCTQLLLIPTVDKEGKRVDGEWFDDVRCEPVIAEPIVLPGKQALSAVSERRMVGGDQEAPKR